MKYTNLDLVQAILSSMDSDEVNSVGDTTESKSVLSIVKTAYFDIAGRGRLTRNLKILQLTPSNDPARPVTMTLPSTVVDLEWVRYNWASVEQPQAQFREVTPLPLVDFLDMILNLSTTESNVISYTENVNGSPVTLLATNNKPPTYYSTIDDQTIVFDSYDAAVDITLQAIKTMCFGEFTPVWFATDDFVPELDDKQHQLLLHEAKSLAFAELKQTVHAKAEKSARQIWVNQQSAKTKTPLQTAQQRGPNYGRK